MKGPRPPLRSDPRMTAIRKAAALLADYAKAYAAAYNGHSKDNAQRAKASAAAGIACLLIAAICLSKIWFDNASPTPIYKVIMAISMVTGIAAFLLHWHFICHQHRQ